jgi:hypothetical protein
LSNVVNRRNFFPALTALAIPTIANATGKITPPKCECKDGKDGKNGKDGKDGLPGPKGDKGDKGDPGECKCNHELKSVHADFELTIAGYPAGLPEVIVNTPSTGVLMDELWYYPKLGACVFFDYSKPEPEFIAFWRGGEFPTWDKVTPMGIRVWNWHVHNNQTGRNHVCLVSLDKILAKPGRIIQNWTKITPSFGSF